MKQLILVGWGRYTFSKASGRLSAMLVKKPWERILAATAGGLQSHGTPVKYIASEHQDTNGALFRATVYADDGDILCMQYSRTVNGVPVGDAAVFVRVSSDGYNLRLQVSPPRTRESLLPDTFSLFEGKGHVLTARELLQLGVEVPKNFRLNFMDGEEVAEMISVEQSGASAAIKIEGIQQLDGTTQALVVSEPRRRMRVRRP